MHALGTCKPAKHASVHSLARRSAFTLSCQASQVGSMTDRQQHRTRYTLTSITNSARCARRLLFWFALCDMHYSTTPSANWDASQKVLPFSTTDFTIYHEQVLLVFQFILQHLLCHFFRAIFVVLCQLLSNLLKDVGSSALL